MNGTFVIERLTQNRDVFKALLEGISPEQYEWQERPGGWCLLEVVCHLIDEEVEDFRTRVRVTLSKPDTSPPPIDPVGWVTSRDYKGQDYDQKVGEFLEERDRSIKWLKDIKNPNWENAYLHPKLGSLSAELFLHNWLAHDYLHIRQINRIKYSYFEQQSGQNLSYAGNW